MTQTATIMFTDIAGYTASVNAMQREDIRKLVERHESIVTGFLRSKHFCTFQHFSDHFFNFLFFNNFCYFCVFTNLFLIL